MSDPIKDILAVADWLDENAEQDEQRAKGSRAWPSLAEAAAHDALQRRRAASSLRGAVRALATKAEGR